MDAMRVDELTPQQHRIIELVASGLTDAEVSRELGISVSTMQRRLREAARAVAATSRVNLVVRALELRLAQVFRQFEGS